MILCLFDVLAWTFHPLLIFHSFLYSSKHPKTVAQHPLPSIRSIYTPFVVYSALLPSPCSQLPCFASLNRTQCHLGQLSPPSHFLTYLEPGPLSLTVSYL